MDVNQDLVDTYLSRAIEEFNTNPLSSRLIRRMAYEFPEQFTAGALRHLTAGTESAAHRFLALMMVRQKSVYEEVGNPSRGSRERSLTLLRQLIAIDPSFDVKLARKLPDRTGMNHFEAVSAASACRILDILNEISAGRRLLPILAHLIDSPDPGTRALATLFVGRRLKSPAWAAEQLKRADDRVRANAVESIWGLRTEPARHLLECCANDDCNRVAGNALVGLHLIGKPGIFDEINHMATAERPAARSTAAWAMGRIGDPGFITPLTTLLRDEYDEVRSTAIHSLVEIRKALESQPVLETVAPESKPSEPSPAAAQEPGQALKDTDIKLDGRSFFSPVRTVRVG